MSILARINPIKVNVLNLNYMDTYAVHSFFYKVVIYIVSIRKTMADLLIWKDEWNTFIPNIDEQHLELSNHLNKIIELVSEPDVTSKLCTIETMLDDLLELTRQHFTYEEMVMLQSNYSDYAIHKKEHMMLVAELIEHIRDIKQQKQQLDTNSLQALKNWFVAHIVISDKKFANYYHKNNQA